MSRFSAPAKRQKAQQTGSRSFSAGALAPVANLGTCRIPGMTPMLRLYEAHDSYQRPFAMVGIGRSGRYTVSVRCSATPRLDSTSFPEWGIRVAGALRGLADPALADIGVSADSVRPGELRFSITYAADGVTPARPGGVLRRRSAGFRDVAVHIGAQLPQVCSRIESVGGVVMPVDATALVFDLRAAFDSTITRLPLSGGTRPAPRWREVPPAATREAWGHVVHDGSTSAVWTMPGHPEDQGLLDVASAPSTDPGVRLTVAFPSRGGRAQEAGKPPPAALTVLTVTTTRPDNPSESLESVHAGLAPGVRWQLRRAYGGQSAAFAAGLGLGAGIPGQVKPAQSLGAAS